MTLAWKICDHFIFFEMNQVAIQDFWSPGINCSIIITNNSNTLADFITINRNFQCILQPKHVIHWKPKVSEEGETKSAREQKKEN